LQVANFDAAPPPAVLVRPVPVDRVPRRRPAARQNGRRLRLATGPAPSERPGRPQDRCGNQVGARIYHKINRSNFRATKQQQQQQVPVLDGSRREASASCQSGDGVGALQMPLRIGCNRSGGQSSPPPPDSGVCACVQSGPARADGAPIVAPIIGTANRPHWQQPQRQQQQQQQQQQHRQNIICCTLLKTGGQSRARAIAKQIKLIKMNDLRMQKAALKAERR
jgi:hypothetical protein